MITAIDFGCYEIRSAHRSISNAGKIVLTTERSEYTILPNEATFADAVANEKIPYAVCEDSLVAFGSRASEVRWLSRKPSAPLFTDGQVPTQDAPARQILNVLTQSLLPATNETSGVCCFTAPGGRDARSSVEFLSRLIRMYGYQPEVCSVTEAINLASGSETGFTCVTICMGTERTEISVSRYGAEIATQSVDVGSNWIDTEFARQLKMQVWDDTGESYLDLEAVREWKHDPALHLRRSIGERARTLSRLYGVVLDAVARTVRTLIDSPAVARVLKNARFTVNCSGGPTLIGGFAGALTERFVEQDTASRILAIRVVDNPEIAVVRGLLIHGELEARRSVPVQYAA